MPQAARKDVTAQRAQDKESKRARGAMSCAECRRLKLKCDKIVPCSSCKRRGCAQICPNGSLITGQGTRFVLADTEKLHQKIADMSDRIRQLEDALAILQSTQTREPHPLLHRDLLKIKSSIELHSAVDGDTGKERLQQEESEDSQYIDAFGTLAIRDDGVATFYGRSAGSESLLIGEASDRGLNNSFNLHNSLNGTWHPQLPRTIQNLSSSFPLSSSSNFPVVDLDHLIKSFVPPWQEAWRLCELYLDQAPWFFGAVTEKHLLEEILPLWYPGAATLKPSPPPLNDVAENPGVATYTPKIGSHELALLFMIFCFGAYTDISLPAAPDNPDAEQYFQLSRAALSIEPVLERPPSVATVQTLSLMAIYQGMCSGENSIESTWALMGMATKLAQSIGLHRDCARWQLPPAEVQKRRALFWELFITDGWQSLATGRLATFSLPFVDCELPYDPKSTMADDGSVQPSFPFWKARFGAECVAAVVQGTLTSRAPKYSVILELDRIIRDVELPKYALDPPVKNAGLAQTMSHYMPHNYRHLTLLYVHRCFFAHAINSNPTDPIKSQYAPSFLAGYRSSCELLNGLKTQFSLFPAQIARFWVLWTHAFSSSVMLSSVVTHCPQSKVAPAALIELRIACDLFEKASSYGGRAGKFLPILQRLQEKAQQSFLDTHSGIPPAMRNDIFTPRKDEKKDELSIFSGQTHTVATKVNNTQSRPSTQQSSAGPSPPLSASSSSTSTSTPTPSVTAQPLPTRVCTANPSFAGVHPNLVEELHGFDGRLNAQIQHAYYVNHDAFAGTLLENQSQSRQEQHPPQPVPQSQSQSQSPTEPQRQQQQATYAVYPRVSEPPNVPAVPSGYHAGANGNGTLYTPNTNYEYDFTSPPSNYSQHAWQDPALAYNNNNNQYVSESHSQIASQTWLNHPQQYTHLQQQHHHSNPQSQPKLQLQQQQQQNTYATSDYAYPMGAQQQQMYANLRPITRYTPDAVMHGYAAEDHNLQEHWKSFMYQVGSPRQFMDNNDFN